VRRCNLSSNTPATWREISRSEFAAGPGDEANFTVLIYERIVPKPYIKPR